MLVRARGLMKRFDDFVAVNGIDFDVHRGEAFGFLGPNGAGKTSAMRMLGCTSPTSGGLLEVFGLDTASSGPEIRGRLGVVAQEDHLDVDLTVWDNIVIYGRYFGIPMKEIRRRGEDLLEFARLTDRRTDKVDPLSGGMKRRLAIARALINQPELILLDEPTTGLDPQARHLLWERLYSLKAQGVSLVITTHYMDEAEQLCDRLVVMDEGRIVDEGSPAHLITKHVTSEVVEVRYANRAEQDRAEQQLQSRGMRTEGLADRVLVYTDNSLQTQADLDQLDGPAPASLLVRRASLEDVFLKLTGRTLQEG